MPGAPKGNRNAIKHGVYARLYTEKDRQALKLARPGVQDEIDCLRIVVSRVFEYLNRKPVADYDETDLAAALTLMRLLLSVGTLLQVEFDLAGNDNSLDQSIRDAELAHLDDWSLA